MNAHMKNTAYLDFAANVRMIYFQAHGFPIREFERLRFGPVIRRDEVEYFRELRLLEAVRVTYELAGSSADGSRFLLRNEFYKEDGKLAARVNSTGGWLNLVERKLMLPPPELVAAMSQLTQTEDFVELDSSVSG